MLTAFDTGDGPLVGTNLPSAETDYFTCPLSWDPPFANIIMPKLAHLSTYWLLGVTEHLTGRTLKDAGAEGRGRDEVAGGTHTQLQAIGSGPPGRPSWGDDSFWPAIATHSVFTSTQERTALHTSRTRNSMELQVAKLAELKHCAPSTAWPFSWVILLEKENQSLFPQGPEPGTHSCISHSSPPSSALAQLRTSVHPQKYGDVSLTPH